MHDPSHRVTAHGTSPQYVARRLLTSAGRNFPWRVNNAPSAALHQSNPVQGHQARAADFQEFQPDRTEIEIVFALEINFSIFFDLNLFIKKPKVPLFIP